MRSCAVTRSIIKLICQSPSQMSTLLSTRRSNWSLHVAPYALWFPSSIPAYLLFSVLLAGGTDPPSGRSSPLPLRPDSRPVTPPLSQTPKHFHLPGRSWSAPCHCSSLLCHFISVFPSIFSFLSFLLLVWISVFLNFSIPFSLLFRLSSSVFLMSLRLTSDQLLLYFLYLSQINSFTGKRTNLTLSPLDWFWLLEQKGFTEALYWQKITLLFVFEYFQTRGATSTENHPSTNSTVLSLS